MARILLTGAAGDIGTRLRKILKPFYPQLRLSDIKEPADLGADEEFVPAELARIEDVERAVDGVDGVIHLGGFSVEGPWERILQSNIIGCYNVFEAARRKGVKRIVFASSNHAVGFYPRHHHIGVNVAVRPDSRYGVSKAFGEALGALYADKHGLRVLCLRIGNVGEVPIDKRRLAIWLKPEDLARLIQIGLQHPDLRFEIFYGSSWNERGWWDNHRAYDYSPHGTRRGLPRARHGRAGQAQARSDRRLLSGRQLLQPGVHGGWGPGVEDLMSRPCALSAPQFTQGTPGADARELSHCEVGAP